LSIGKIFNLPTVISTVQADGPHGHLPAYVKEIKPDAKVIDRLGEFIVFDNEEFQKAIKDLGKKKLIVAGLEADVSVGLSTLAMLEAGYEVYTVRDVIGTFEAINFHTGLARLTQAGVIPITWFAVGAEIMHDLRRPGGQEFMEVLAKHMPYYSTLVAGYKGSAFPLDMKSKLTEKSDILGKTDIKALERNI
jgi:hypothetical protein